MKSKIRHLKFKTIVTSFLLSIIILFTTACNDKEVNTRQVDLSTGKQDVGLTYSKSQKVDSLDSVDDFVSPKQQQELLNPSQIPNSQQPIINRANPENKLLEKTGQMFEDAGNF